VTEPAAELYPPVLLKEWVVFPTTGTIEVYDLTWKKLRSFALPFALRSGAAGSGTRVYAGADYSRGGRVAAFDVRQRPYTSRPDWELMTFGGISSSPACWQENIYAGSRDGKVYAMRAEDRASIWHMMPGGVFDTGASIAADLKVDNEGLYVATMNSILFCLDPVSGRVRWQYYSGHALPEAPVLTLGTVYLGVPDKGLVAIDKGPGPIRPEKWVAADAVKYLGEDSQDVFAVGQGGKILALDRSTGSVKFSSSSSYSAFTPNPGQSVVFVATDGKVFAIVPVRTPGQAGQLAMAQ
jgi:outer membrane protein assembly factor BamB